MFSSSNLPISTSTPDCAGRDFSAAGEDVGAFISSSAMWIGLRLPNPNDISSPVNTCLGFLSQAAVSLHVRCSVTAKLATPPGHVPVRFNAACRSVQLRVDKRSTPQQAVDTVACSRWQPDFGGGDDCIQYRRK